MDIYQILFIILFLWVIALSFEFYKIRKHYRNLIKRTKKQNIDDILDLLIEKDINFEKEQLDLKKQLEELKELEKFHYQKIGFLRFNPFDRIGGDQSFVLSLLNNQDSGIVLNFLYTREGMRIYSKRVKNGKSEEYELSSEELESIKKAY